MNKETISSDDISPSSLVNYVNRVLNLGLDVHYRQVTVAMQENGGRIKSAVKMGHVDFLNWVQKKLQEGWQIYSCYEAGASGYWLHRELVRCIVDFLSGILLSLLGVCKTIEISAA